MSVALELKGLSKSFGTRHVVQDLSFSLPVGARLCIFGPNGAGKTTLLRMLALLERPSSGSFRVLGYDPRENGEKIRARIGFISHNPMLYLDLSPEENLLMFARLHGVDNPKKRVRTLLDAVELSQRRFEPVRGFSHGMLQRVSIARAFINDPELIFLDEPYAGLDPRAARIVRALVASYANGRTLTSVSHELERGYADATHVLVLALGRPFTFVAKEKLTHDAFMALVANYFGGDVL